MLRNSLRVLAGVGQQMRRIGMPCFLLAARLWIGQVVFAHQFMAMVQQGSPGQPGGPLHVPDSVATALHGVAPLLIAAGLLTRPVAAALLISSLAARTWFLDGVEPSILIWLMVAGAGTFSLDALLDRGVPFAALGPLRWLRSCYRFVSWCFVPLMLFATRIGMASALYLFATGGTAPVADMMRNTFVLPPGVPAWLALGLACVLALGLATRLVAAVCVLLVASAAGALMSMDQMLAVLLLLLALVAAGGGALSVDRLLRRWSAQRAAAGTEGGAARPRVVVVGGGFGGVAAVRRLRNTGCDVTLIDRRNYHLFQPLLYQAATAALSTSGIATPIRSLFRGQRNVRVRLGEVIGIDTETREVELPDGKEPYDYLVLATGARHGYFGKDHWAPYAPGLKNVEDAASIRSRLLRAFEAAESSRDAATRDAWLTFVIVGGGPTGIELAGAIAELARHGLAGEYHAIDPAAARVILLHAGPRVLPTFHPALSAVAQRSLRKLGVDVRLDTRVLDVDDDGVMVGEQRIAARTVLWAAGVTASPAASWLGLAADNSGRVGVGADLSVPGHERIFAIGDTAASLAWNGAAVPGLAPAAKQQGRYVASLIDARIHMRRAPSAFRYRHLGSLATIGRQSAVIEFGRLRIWGAPAWWLWGAAHIVFLGGGRNRLAVALDWLWAYLTYRRSARLIVDNSR
ncbi:MAG TPA: NAD(P)/FAD-dependent oxidoreductase [Paraburkholderia sp.]|nr:NAD(P)/FAD-dependent oxidoreductase [Paraburkholderia sp.]